MSKFFKALEQARQDRALRKEAPLEPARFTEASPDKSWRPEPAALPQPANEPAGDVHGRHVGPRERPAAAPHPASEPADGVDQHLVSLLTPAAYEAEQYRALRHIVEQLHRAGDLQVIAVSSPGAGDGKTTTAINLAGALAQAPEARVLLVDADLRQPSLARLLGLGDSGVTDLVGGIVDPSLTLDRIVQPRPPFNLSVICTAQAPPSAYELLKSPRLGELVEEARRRYDFIVIDTPPLTPFQDCRVIGRWVDGFLLVVAAHRTPRRLVEEALTTLDHTKVFGFVFNEDVRSISDHYSSYYGGRYSPGRPFPDSPQSGAFTRAVRSVGDSLWRRRGRGRLATVLSRKDRR
jgi:protein-tyrosine kinase